MIRDDLCMTVHELVTGVPGEYSGRVYFFMEEKRRKLNIGEIQLYSTNPCRQAAVTFVNGLEKCTNHKQRTLYE